MDNTEEDKNNRNSDNRNGSEKQNDMIKREYFLNPGHIFYPTKPTMIYAVVGSGLAVTFYDKKNKKGLMCYAFLPKMDDDEPSTAIFIEPAVKGSLAMMLKTGTTKESIEVHVYGGADNLESVNYKEDINKENISKVKSVFNEEEISVVGMDVGGKRGRKIIFNSETGETATVKVGNIREHDWYPVA